MSHETLTLGQRPADHQMLGGSESNNNRYCKAGLRAHALIKDCDGWLEILFQAVQMHKRAKQVAG